MLKIGEDKSISVTRGDSVVFGVSQKSKDGTLRVFNVGDVVRFTVVKKKDYSSVVLQKDFAVEESCEVVDVVLTSQETRIGDTINKAVEYWYEVEVNPGTSDTIIGHDESGAKLFWLYPEAEAIEQPAPDPEEIPVVDGKLDVTSERPVENRVVAKAILLLEKESGNLSERVDEIDSQLGILTSRAQNLATLDKKVDKIDSQVEILASRVRNFATLKEGSTTGDAELTDVRVGYDGTVYESAGEAVRKQVEAVKDDIPLTTTRNHLNVTWRNAGLNTSGGISDRTDGVNGAATPEFIAVTGGETYTLSWVLNTKAVTMYLYQYREDYTYINNWVRPVSNVLGYHTFQVDAECAYIRLSLWGTYPNYSWEYVIPENLQLELGNTQTRYVPPIAIDSEALDTDTLAEKMQAIKTLPYKDALPVDAWEVGMLDYTSGVEFVSNQWARTSGYVKLRAGDVVSTTYNGSYVQVLEFDPVTLDLLRANTNFVTSREVQNDCMARIAAWYNTEMGELEDVVSCVKITRNKNKVIDAGALPYEELHRLLHHYTDFNYAAYGLPVLEFSGDISSMNKDNAVTLSYKYGERTGTCTLKWQGSSSLAYPKKNYTVKFDTAFEAKSGWGEQKKYCLKANYIDFSHSRNICSAKLWGNVVKSRTPENNSLNALQNAGAIDGFPICVVINGEYIGLYTFNIPKDAWMFGMGNGDAEAIVCADNTSADACAFKGLATLDGDFEVEYAPDEDNTEWIQTSLNRLLQACIDCDSAEDFDNNVAQYLDVESAIDYLIQTLMICHHDGIIKNYILATYDGVKWFFSAYDMDSTFGLAWDGKKILNITHRPLNDMCSMNRVFYLLRKYKAYKIKARYEELTNGALREDMIIKTFNDFIGSIPKALYDKEVTLWTALPSTSVNNISQVGDFVRRRKELIDAQIEAL